MARVSARSPQTDDQINGFAAGLPRWLDGLHGDEREQSMPLMLTAMGLALIGGVLVVDTPTNIGHAIYEARTELENSGTLGHITVIVLLTVGLANRYPQRRHGCFAGLLVLRRHPLHGRRELRSRRGAEGDGRGRGDPHHGPHRERSRDVAAGDRRHRREQRKPVGSSSMSTSQPS